MSESGVPEDLQELLREHIESIEQLEILSLLHARPGEIWSTAAMAAQLQLPEALVHDASQRLCVLGMLAAEPADHYGYRPADPQLTRDSARILELYARERAVVLRLLSTHAIQRLRAGALSAFGAAKHAPTSQAGTKLAPTKQGGKR